ncbi:hypothetical protein NQ314_000347 [Rhamnusium bicolor]|uniref:Fatty acyl-CoA reductase n=1 Tax=Rhamnusium bicolor TaxID=1586634 RepID=A0AAV8ZWX2_9CUCU|nr:hypothetical protein NQ314_000347 [Rhamnusium bicolor]
MRRKNIFITGASGFLGICLLEKILRTIYAHGDIYLLLRPKRGKEIAERLEEIKKNQIFEVVLKEKSIEEVFAKVKVVAGDVGQDNLGLSESDRKLLTDNINVIFHSAATLDFGDTLKATVDINLLGTRRITQLAKDCAYLDALVHVSSAYVNSWRLDAEEIIYPLKKDAEDVIALVNKLSPEELEEQTRDILGDHPNTYTITKHMAEHEIQKIVGAWKEPVPGWTISKNGPQGFLMGAAKGIVRRLPVGLRLVYDYIPVDLVVNELIVAGFYVGTHYKTEDGVSVPLHFKHEEPISLELHRRQSKCVPTQIPVKICHLVSSFEIVAFCNMVQNFCLVCTLFPGPNIGHCHKAYRGQTYDWLTTNDKVDYNLDVGPLVWEDYFQDLTLGCRIYLSKEPAKTLKAAKGRENVLLAIHLVWQAAIFSLVWYIFACITGMTMSASAYVLPICFVLYNLL